MNQKYKRLASDTGLFALGNFGSKFILFFLVPLYTNVMTSEEYGTADLITTSVYLIFPFLTLSINDSILRFCLDKKEDPKKILWQAMYVLLSSSVLTLIAYPIILQLNLFCGYDKYFLFIALLYPYRSALSLYLKATNKVRLFAIDSILYTIVLCISNILLLLVFKLGLVGYLLSQIIAITTSIVYIITIGKAIRAKDAVRIDKELLKRMLAYCVPMIANAASWWVINSSDRYMLKYMMDASSVGIYSVATKMPSLLTSIVSVFYQAWLISAIVEYEEGRDKRFYENVFTFYSIILIVGASAGMIVLKPFMRLYVGPDFTDSWRYVPILLIASIFSTFANFFMALYKSAKKNIREVISTSLGAAINIILNFSLIPIIGIQGACVATLLSEAAMAFFVIFDTRRFFCFEINFRRFIISLSIVVIQSVMLVWDLSTSVVIPFSFACVFSLSAMYFRELKKIIVSFIQKIIKRKSTDVN